jgi:hypothetical protein
MTTAEPLEQSAPRQRHWASAVGHALVDPWLLPKDARSLAVCRIILFWFAWPGFSPSGGTAFAAFRGTTFRGVGILGALHVPLLPASALQTLGYVDAVASGFALLGFAYPIAAPIAAFAELYFSWVVQSSGKINHGDLVLTWVMLVIAFSRAADAWSLDALLRRLRGKPRPAWSAAYHWPVRFIGLLVATQYGAAGLSKLKRSGLEWGLGGSLRWRLLSHQFTHSPPTKVGVWIARSPLLCQVLGTAALLLEVSGPLSQLHRWAYRVIIPSLAFLQLSIWLMMGVFFRPMIPVFACLLPWHELIVYVERKVSALRGAPHAH